MSVDREHGSISWSQSEGNTILTMLLDGDHPEDNDQMDRILQFAMVDMGIDTSWQVPPPPPDPEEHPPVIPEIPDVPPENMPSGEVPV